MSYILALDQGTTSSRAVIFDRHGQVKAQAQQEFAQHFPKPGWVEHDPEDIWETTRRTAIAAVADANLTGAQIAAIGLTNQRETTLLWDRSTGKPLAPAIVWQDRRTAGMCARLKKAGHEPLFRRKTGLLLDPYFSGTKLAWLLDHVPGARRRAARGELAFGTVDSWLLWKLTDGRIHATDATNASRTLLYDLRSGTWDEKLLQLLRIPRAVLPEIRSCSEVYGEVSSIRHGQEYLWHRLFHAAQHRREARRVEAQAAHHARLENRPAHRVCAGGQCFYWGRGCAMAARWAWAHLALRRNRGSCGAGAG
jgi:glycerol kinase